MNQEVELVAASHMEMKCTMRECSLEIPMLKLSLEGGGTDEEDVQAPLQVNEE